MPYASHFSSEISKPKPSSPSPHTRRIIDHIGVSHEHAHNPSFERGLLREEEG
jgi:hypothetical protein